MYINAPKFYTILGSVHGDKRDNDLRSCKALDAALSIRGSALCPLKSVVHTQGVRSRSPFTFSFNVFCRQYNYSRGSEFRRKHH